MISVILETESREKKRVCLYKDGKEYASRATSGNLLVCLIDLLKEKGISLKEIESIKAVPEVENSISARVGETHAQAIRYILGISDSINPLSTNR